MSTQPVLTDSAAYRRILVGGWVTAAGLALLAGISWTGMVYQPTWLSNFLLLPSVALPAIFFLRGISAAHRVPARTILKFAILFAAIGFFTLPFQSTDVFFYMAKGWQQSHYASNPYAEGLRELDSPDTDPMISTEWNALNRNPWLDLPLPYGFFFATLVRLLAGLGGGNWWLTLILFDITNLLCHAGVGWLVWRLSHALKTGDPNRALYLYAWNPFVIAQFIGDLHNDILVAFFVILAVYTLAVRRPEWTLTSIVAAGLIKYVAFALTPFAALAIYRLYGRRKFMISGLWATVAGIVVSTPYLIDASAFKLSMIAGQLTESSRSFHAFVFGVLKLIGITGDRFPSLVRVLATGLQTVLWIAFVVFVIGELQRLRTRRITLDRIVCQWSATLAFLLFFSSSQLYPWYIGMLLPLAVLGYQSWVSRAVILASAAHLLGFTGLKRIGYFLICTLLPFALTFFSAVRLKILRAIASYPPPMAARRRLAEMRVATNISTLNSN